jgi:hypothetical protein
MLAIRTLVPKVGRPTRKISGLRWVRSPVSSTAFSQPLAAFRRRANDGGGNVAHLSES